MCKQLLLASLILAQVIYINGFAWAVVRIATSAIGLTLNVVDKTMSFINNAPMWTVEVHNEGTYDAHLWCASANDKIGGSDGLSVKPGDKVMWSFRRFRPSQYWCTLDWNSQRVGWDVFVGNWHDAPDPTKWSIRDDGIYDQWRERKWRHLNS